MRRLLYIIVLSMIVMAMTASVALAQSRGPSGADGSFNCEDFDTQPQAQAFFEANNPQQDPDGLDRDDDGLACEDSLPGGSEEEIPALSSAEDSDDASTAGAQYAGDDQYASADQYDDEDAVVPTLPDTGGPALLPLAGLILLGAGAMFFRRLM